MGGIVDLAHTIQIVLISIQTHSALNSRAVAIVRSLVIPMKTALSPKPDALWVYALHVLKIINANILTISVKRFPITPTIVSNVNQMAIASQAIIASGANALNVTKIPTVMGD